MTLDFSTPFGQQAHEQLQTEPVVWLTTTAADGTPQPNLIWFLYQDGDIIFYTQPGAARLKNLENNAKVSLNFNSDPEGHHQTVILGTAVVDQSIPRLAENDVYLEKYTEGIKGMGSDPESMANDYSVALRVTLNKLRGF